MATRLLIDTDILIDYLRGVPEAIAFLEMATATLYISSITVAELFAGVREGRERTTLGIFLDAFEIVSIDREIAERGGLYRREYGKSHAVGLADSLIAACATQLDAPLATLNVKHYPMFASLSAPYRKTLGKADR